MRWTGRVPQPRVRVTPRASKCVDDTPGVDDALIQPYSGHASRQSLEIYSRLALSDAQASYDQAIGRFPV